MVGERRHRRFGNSARTLDRNPSAPYPADRSRSGCRFVHTQRNDRAGCFRPLTEARADSKKREPEPAPRAPDMTSLEQIESNRRNALRSTGPKTETGKQRSSKNAVRHGLTAETVIEPLEDSEDYKAFEQAVTADYDAETAVERELVLRLASLLWRLRRSTSIETGLFQIQNEALHEHRTRPTKKPSRDFTPVAALRIGQSASALRSLELCRSNEAPVNVTTKPELRLLESQFNIARSFLGFTNLDNSVFERLGRYEMALWRQVRQTLFTLEGMRWRSRARNRPGHRFGSTDRNPVHCGNREMSF